jgi:hypothetical protein
MKLPPSASVSRDLAGVACGEARLVHIDCALYAALVRNLVVCLAIACGSIAPSIAKHACIRWNAELTRNGSVP